MRRRERLAELVVGPPELAGPLVVSDWVDAAERLPEGWHGDAGAWRHLAARLRRRAAQDRWCDVNGVDRSAVFRGDMYAHLRVSDRRRSQ